MLLSTETLMLTTVLVIGVTIGAVTVRDALNAELAETAQALCCLNQSYSFSGMTNSASSMAGTAGVDLMSDIMIRDLQARGVHADAGMVGE